jgi:hypothetical protein
VNLETLSSFALMRMLSDCADGSATQRRIQEELKTREENVKHSDNKTPWLFSDEELKTMHKKWGPRK